MSASVEAARRARFRRIARSLDALELQRDDAAPGLSEAELVRDLREPPRATRVLGYYSARGIERAFERYGLLPGLRARGFGALQLTVDPADPYRQLVRVLGAKGAGPRRLLMELVVRRGPLRVSAAPAFETLFVEWLLLQDPGASFTPLRPRLPGQEHPGLGLAHDVEGVLLQACRRLGLDGLAHRPSHYHSALEASGDFRFLDPAAEGRYRALRAALAGRALAEAAWLAAGGRVRTERGLVLGWVPADRVLAASARLREQVTSPAYEALAERACRGWLDAGLRVEPGR